MQQLVAFAVFLSWHGVDLAASGPPRSNAGDNKREHIIHTSIFLICFEIIFSSILVPKFCSY